MICWRTVAGLVAVGAVAALGFWLLPPGHPKEQRDPGPTLPENVWVEYLPIDGRLVTCTFRSSQGIDCDWANARPLDAGAAPSTTPPT